VVVYCRDPVRAAAMGQEYRGAFKAAILERVPPHISVSFSRTTFLPAIADWSRFRSGEVRVGGLERVSAEGRMRLFKDDSRPATIMPERSPAGAGRRRSCRRGRPPLAAVR
jgi:hypothetical protein